MHSLNRALAQVVGRPYCPPKLHALHANMAGVTDKILMVQRAIKNSFDATAFETRDIDVASPAAMQEVAMRAVLLVRRLQNLIFFMVEITKHLCMEKRAEWKLKLSQGSRIFMALYIAEELHRDLNISEAKLEAMMELRDPLKVAGTDWLAMI